jgi:hypothetical protein
LCSLNTFRAQISSKTFFRSLVMSPGRSD